MSSSSPANGLCWPLTCEFMNSNIPSHSGDVSYDPCRGELAASIVAGYERHLWQLEKEVQEQRQINTAQCHELADKERRCQALIEEAQVLREALMEHNQTINAQRGELQRLEIVANSKSWQLVEQLWRVRRAVLPLGSLRHKVLRFGWRTFQSLSRRNGTRITRINDAAPPQQNMSIPSVRTMPPVEPHSVVADVIFCAQGSLAGVRRVLDAVIRHTRQPYQLLLIDDGSEGETRDYLAQFAAEQGAVLLRHEQPRGFPAAANQALQQAQSDYAVVLNGNVVVTSGWLDRLLACGESDPRLGLIAPLSNAEAASAQDDAANDLLEDLPKGFDDFDDDDVDGKARLVAAYSGRLYPRLRFLEGDCFAVKRQLIEQIGLFDEERFRADGGVKDYCLRARRAGFDLAVADDVYVYQGEAVESEIVADSRERRLLTGIRARAAVMQERERLTLQGRERWEGKRLLFLVPPHSDGGAYAVLGEVEAMIKMGVDVRLLNSNEERAGFNRRYPDLEVPIIHHTPGKPVEHRLAGLGAVFDAVVTTYHSIKAIKSLAPSSRKPALGCYVQNYEPGFFSTVSEEGTWVQDSYTGNPDCVHLVRAEWTRREIEATRDVRCALVGPSVNLDLFRPRPRQQGNGARITIAMRMPHREPQSAIELFERLHREHGDKVELLTFGCALGWQALPIQFPHRHLDELTRPQLAGVLNEADIFVDLSARQTSDLTALEAMACGAAVIVLRQSGAEAFVQHEDNGLIVETEAECYAALEQLVTGDELRQRLQQRAITAACRYAPERAAYRMLFALFQNGNQADEFRRC